MQNINLRENLFFSITFLRDISSANQERFKKKQVEVFGRNKSSVLETEIISFLFVLVTVRWL